MSASSYLRGKILAHALRTASWAKPAGQYLALFVGGIEVVGGGYARIAFGPGDAFWSDQSAGDGRSVNLQDAVFASPTADWGLIDSFALYDAIAAGNQEITGVLTTPVLVQNGMSAPRFPAGLLAVTVA